MFRVFYTTRFLKETRYCGDFNTLSLASEHVHFMQNNLSNGMKLVFKIVSNSVK